MAIIVYLGDDVPSQSHYEPDGLAIPFQVLGNMSEELS